MVLRFRGGKDSLPTKRRSGFTLLEVIAVVAMLAVVFGFAGVRFAAPSSRVVSAEFSNVIQQARFEAVRANRGVAVVWLEDARQLVTRVQSAADAALICGNTDGQVIVADFTRYPRVEVDPDLGTEQALVWLPNGQARTCSLAPLPRQQIATVSDGREQYRILISVTGRVSRGRL